VAKTQKLGVARNSYTSLYSATGVPTEEAFCETKIAIAQSARKARTQKKGLAKTIIRPLGQTQGMTRSLSQPLSRNNVVVQRILVLWMV